MTCIVGVIGPDGTITMGGDSAGVSDGRLELRKDAKVFRNGPYLIGCCGKWRVAQLLKFARLPEPKKGDMFEHMVTKFIPRLQLLLKGQDNYSMLVGMRGHIFHLYADLQVAEAVEEYAAAGSGAQVAKGALYTVIGPPAMRVTMALHAAERYCTDVRGPFTILSI